MNPICPYEVLDLERHATIPQVKKAYRNLALKYHPDRAKFPYQKEMYTERMVKINDAYAVLSDAKKKGIYDRYGIVDDGQTEIVIDESEEILTKYNSELKDDGFYKGDAPVEEEHVDKGTVGQRIGRWLRGTTPRNLQCGKCRGAKILHVKRGFFEIEEYCDRCDGKGYITKEIDPYYNKPAPRDPNKNSYEDHQKNWGPE